MREFWRNRRVFLTGHTGFKGTWMSLWLRSLGAQVTGYALAPDTQPNLFTIVRGRAESLSSQAESLSSQSESHIADIRDEAGVRRALIGADPQIVIHMAAQALVRESYRDPLATYATNVMGTAILLQVCRALKRLECVLIVTSDKVYENHGEGRPFVEADRLGGHDPYSNSKACAELVTGSFRDSFFTDGPPIASARAGNVIGGGDWAKDRLVPDLMRDFAAGRRTPIRFPNAVRPWQHVLEPLSGYMELARRLWEGDLTVAEGWNFGPAAGDAHPVRWIADR
ncbi:MAG TPA: CDP-glucose 4,6-dehydratase, partial [Steroidobacteraceae bacterium]|nr:CDP-glucose 4,6-dehydratase [Steroidobacteraceae bacterium]